MINKQLPLSPTRCVPFSPSSSYSQRTPECHQCPGCPYGGLDLTRGLFEFFAPLGVGVLDGDWWFADQAPEPAPAPPKPKPKTTSKPPPPPPTTTHHTTTSHTSTSSSTSSSHSASTSVNYSSTLPTPTSAVSTDGQQNVLDINQVLIGMGGLIIDAT